MSVLQPTTCAASSRPWELRGPVAVAGHDIGSMIALAVAASHPDDVSRLVLINSLLPGLGLQEVMNMNVAEGSMWHFGFFMTEHIPEMPFDGHELEFFTATSSAMSNPGTFTDADLAPYARAPTGRERLRPRPGKRCRGSRHRNPQARNGVLA